MGISVNVVTIFFFSEIKQNIKTQGVEIGF